MAKLTWTAYLVDGFERFANYYMLPTLINIFQSSGMNLDQAQSVFGTFTSSTYLLNPIGGYLGDKIGNFSLVNIGLTFLTFGYSLCAYGFSHSNGNLHITAYLGLMFVAFGQGLFKTNMASMSRTLAIKSNQNPAEVNSKLYSATNIGAMFSGLLLAIIFPYCGLWPCAIAVFFGWVSLQFLQKLYSSNTTEENLINFISKTIVLNTETKIEYKSYFFLSLVILSSFCFFFPFLQINSVIIKYSETFVNNQFTASLPSINSWVIVLLPFVYQLLKIKISSIIQLRWGMLIGAVAFMLLVFFPSSLWSLIVWYVLISIAEYAISPMGVSYILEKAKSHTNLILGMWFLSNALAYKLSAYGLIIAKNYGYTSLFTIDVLLMLLGFFLFYSLFRGEK